MPVIRTCIGCRLCDEQDNLLRLVCVDGEVVDGTCPRLPGRGAYLHPRRACLELAIRRRAFGRAFRGLPSGAQSPTWLQAAMSGWDEGAFEG